jgi:hypothetical protein
MSLPQTLKGLTSRAPALLKSRRFAALVLLPLTLATSAVTQASSPAAVAEASSCGSSPEWSVKVGTDGQARQVNLTPTPTTVAQLARLPLPSKIKHRVSPTEFTVYTITATVTTIHKEHDRDVHLAVHDGSGHHMTTELPDTACVPRSSPFYPGVSKAHSQLRAWSGHTPVKVQITGVGYFDSYNGQPDQAHNQIELHPVLGLTFN